MKMDDTRGVVCLWGSLKNHPQCPHGNRYTYANTYILKLIFMLKNYIFFKKINLL